ncbi:hypothetical protein NEOLEDRAFT_1181063 [Neolentinus lepideus HHB14362 ss-1]|uniref:Zn(2)-C6 fungal-type domain-containing protein n=1 Tax=Neolentinus lepideus HHB14362 ss-1 TaxID=1314782 RepID=A0A165QAV7_9AGAM|nr:hypothetical protein NEOLEDRAFT_1181063 [Neolentinus lepideus HHB14362 ss-1]
MANSPETSAQGSSAPLQRGKACLNCRRRKMKCDGARPVCSQCQRAGRDEDCEYADGGRTRTQILQDTIAELEARIEELENPGHTTSVTLHDPHAPQMRAHPSSSPTQGQNLPVASTSGQASRQLQFYAQSPTQFEQGIAAAPGWWEYDEPPTHIARALIELFLPNTAQFGFFLNTTRFLSATVIMSTLGQENRPLPALMTSVYLIGVHLSTSPEVKQHEGAFLSRLRHQLAIVPAGLQPNQVMQAIQAEVVLASYLFRVGNIVEARYHSSAAVSLVLGYRLHKIRSAEMDVNALGGEFVVTLPPPQDVIEEGERINGFWITMVMDKEWAAALGMPATAGNDDMIDTPFPWNERAYEQNLVPIGNLYSRTVQKFLSGDTTNPLGGEAPCVQATILFERASQFTFRQLVAHADYLSLDARIDEVRQIVFSLETLQMLQANLRLYLPTCTLLYLSTMKLHSRFISENTVALAKCLTAANDLVVLLQRAREAQSLPASGIMGTLCYLASQEIIRYLTIIPTLPPARRPRNFSRDMVVAMLTTTMVALEAFGADSSLTVSQLAELRNAFPGTP